MRLAALFLALLAALGIAAKLAVPRWLKPRIERLGSEACATCELTIGALALELFPPGLEARGVRFAQGDARDSAVAARVNRLHVPVPLRNLLRRGPVRIGFVLLEGADVEVHEGDALFPKAPAGAPGEGFEVEGFQVVRGTFRYRKDSPGGVAWLRLAPVEAVGGRFGTSPALLHEPLLARATATLERSGAVDLRVAAGYFAAPAWADVDLRVSGLRLGSVNDYFEPEEGVTLSGRLDEARGTVTVRGQRAEGRVLARYAGLGLEFHANRHRRGLAALLDNLAAKLKLRGENLSEPPGNALRAVVTARHARESAVSFVLRTLREAALRVATK